MGVDPQGLVLKPNMVISGTSHDPQSEPEGVARHTLAVLRAHVPQTVPGIAFLSGGQSNERACENLQAINRKADDDGGAPWRLTFSFGRALVDDALRTWHGETGKVADAQAALAGNCSRASAACSPSAKGSEAVGV